MPASSLIVKSSPQQNSFCFSEVKHKSFAEVNEEGAEAAAVTQGVMKLTSVRQPTPPFEMVVDRPFLIVIEDNLTNVILFVGVVSDPTSPS